MLYYCCRSCWVGHISRWFCKEGFSHSERSLKMSDDMLQMSLAS